MVSRHWNQQSDCGIKELFTNLKESLQDEGKFGNSSKIPAKDKGNIITHNKSGDLNYIYYVPTLYNNMLNLGQLLRKGLDILTDLSLTIKKEEDKFIAKVHMFKYRFPTECQDRATEVFESLF